MFLPRDTANFLRTGAFQRVHVSSIAVPVNFQTKNIHRIFE